MRTVVAGLVVAAAVAGCYSPTDYDTRPSGVVLRLSAGSVPADGASMVLVEIYAPPQSQSGLSATLAVSAGTLVGAAQGALSVPVASGDTVRAYWQAPLATGTGVVTAKVGSLFVRTGSVVFVAAAPDFVDVEPGSPAVPAKLDSVVSVTIRLRRTIGMPSLGTPVTLTASDASGATVGRFLSSTPSDANGLVTARYAPGTTTYRGPVTITATVTVGATVCSGHNTVIVTD